MLKGADVFTWDANLEASTIPVAYSRIAAHTLGLTEKNLDSLLVKTSLPESALLEDDFSLNGYQQIQILENAFDIAGYPSYGLDFGQRLTPPTHGPLGFLVNSSATLLDALEAFKDYLPLRMHLSQMHFEKTEYWLECRVGAHPAATDRVSRLIVEASSLTLLYIAEFILERTLAEGVLDLAYPVPSYANRCIDVFPCKVNFDAPYSVLKVPVNLITTPNVSAEHSNYEYALHQCQKLLSDLNHTQRADSNTNYNQVKRILLSNPNHQLSEAKVAELFFVSKRTLARRLEKEGTSFKQVREEVLASLAEGYLSNEQLSVETIATLLNYHDSSSFRRAFKRWFGQAPDSYRKTKAHS